MSEQNNEGRSFDEFLSRSQATTQQQVQPSQQSHTVQPQSAFNTTSSMSNQQVPPQQAYTSQPQFTGNTTSTMSTQQAPLQRPSDLDREMSYGVTPVALKNENAHDWSESVINNLEHVNIQTPRGENPPNLGQSSRGQGTGTGVQQQAASAANTVANTASQAASTVSNTASQAATQAKDTLNSAYNTAANALSSGGSQTRTGISTGTSTGTGTGIDTSTTTTGPTAAEQISQAAASGAATVSQAASSGAATVSNLAGQAYNAVANTVSQPTTTGVTGNTGNTTTGSATVPAVVRESQNKAGEPLEASANPYAVERKSEMEDELLSEVKPTPAISGTTTTGQVQATATEYAVQARDSIASAATTVQQSSAPILGSIYNAAVNTASSLANQARQGAAAVYNSAGTNVDHDADERARQTTHTTPAIVKHSQEVANEPPEASAVPSSVEHKQAVEEELLGKVEAAPASAASRPGAQTMDTTERITRNIPGGF